MVVWRSLTIVVKIREVTGKGEKERHTHLNAEFQRIAKRGGRLLLKLHLAFFPVLFFSITLHWSLKKSFLSILAVLQNSAFRWVYLSFSPLPLASLLFTAICKASSDSHFAFLHFFSMGMVLMPASCTVLRTSVHSSSGTLSDLIAWIYLSLPLYNFKGFD